MNLPNPNPEPQKAPLRVLKAGRLILAFLVFFDNMLYPGSAKSRQGTSQGLSHHPSSHSASHKRRHHLRPSNKQPKPASSGNLKQAIGGGHQFENRWTVHKRFQLWGYWGLWGWARPALSWCYTPFWANSYPAGSGFAHFNFGGGWSINQQGNFYQARQYAMAQSSSGPETISTGEPVEADYRLSQGADILPDGKVAIPLNEGAYLLLSEAGTQVMDQASGKSVMSLYNDPAQVAQISLEIRRQRRDLYRAIEKWARQNAEANAWGIPITNTGNSQDEQVQNLQTVIGLLNKSLRTLGQSPASPSHLSESKGDGEGKEMEADQAPLEYQLLGPTPVPVPGALEIMASVWSLPDASYLVIKRADGSLAYMNGKNWYGDQGKTPLAEPYPAAFKKVVLKYLSDVVKGAPAASEALQKDKQNAQAELLALNQDLQDYQDAIACGSNEIIDFGADKVPLSQALKQTQAHIKFRQNRIAREQSELDNLPKQSVLEARLLAISL